MNTLLRLTVNEDGETLDPADEPWHLGTSYGGSNTLLCSGECYNEVGSVASEGAAFAESKERTRGGVTCKLCLGYIADIKSYRE